ncbi:MAG: S1 RNA-binding domain-containing protein [Candidatus Fournierella pullistercoris]|uniref:S1 RNA-binding domain-containing protein n=1 Tax=Candidatus Allofournierella pullistercoris TaxID=2838597 RepID=A0A948T2G1_9FIRM|nr:S1 RNA-binding domain-containing protein [Candidatus Fournierella pullistercoris]
MALELQVGTILEGKVTGVKKFGAFVSLPDQKTGMVHISEVSSSFIEDLSTVLTEGQTVKVKVMNIAEDGKIALSMKRALPPEPRPAKGPRPPRGGRSDAPRVWQPKAQAPQGEMSFEDMMAKFKSQSEEKMSDLKRVTENRRGGGYSRRRG